MIFFLKTNLPKKKVLFVALQKIYGIGEKRAINICNYIGISKELLLIKTPQFFLNEIETHIEEKYTTGTELNQKLFLIKKQEIDLKSYKGLRIKCNLPQRGQRTHTNARTNRKRK